MAEILRTWSSSISSCEMAWLSLRDDGVEFEKMDREGTLKNVIGYEKVREGVYDAAIRNDFGEAVLKELRELLGRLKSV